MELGSLIEKIRIPLRSIKRSCYQHSNRNYFKQHVRPSDVFLVGHPKSGNTWLALMLGVVLERNFDGEITLANVQEFIPAFHAKDGNIGAYADLPNPRVFRNEGPVYPELYPKTIYIVRDPRAVYVSYYRHLVHDNHVLRNEVSGTTMEKFMDEIITHGCLRKLEPYLIRWDKQVAQWLERSDTQAVKIVKYEEMKRDRRAVLEDVLKFINAECDTSDIDRAVERGSFDSMRNEEKTHGAEPYSGTKGEGGFFVRKGKIDGWKDEMPPEIEDRIVAEFSDVMKKFGYL
jgi:hypothetical protein